VIREVVIRDVAILGAGPAGLSAAVRLRAVGIRDIVVIEREEVPGGVPRHCGHPAFGLREFHRLLGGPAYARHLAAAASGIEIRCRSTVTAIEPGGRIRLLDPEQGETSLEARAMLVAFGVRETPRSARLISGDRPWGVVTTGALQQFVYLQKIRPFRRAVVIGSELVAFSALLTLRHAGIEIAAMIEENPRITARRPGDLLARIALGVPVLISTRPVAIHGLTQVEAVEVEQAGQRRRIACDGVVFTGCFRPETAVLAGSHIALDPGSGGPAIDQYWRSSDPRIFVAGNLLHPVETAGIAWAEGRAAAEAIALHLAGRLPPPAAEVPITAKPPFRYVYPQRLALPVTGLFPLLLKARAARAARGRLTLLADGCELWSRRMSLLPERRISLPADRLPRDGFSAITVEMEEER
jgi:NADPH-dependent 2,4-dienoyl-CoA reductase/sulfur reductase-like enzyme